MITEFIDDSTAEQLLTKCYVKLSVINFRNIQPKKNKNVFKRTSPYKLRSNSQNTIVSPKPPLQPPKPLKIEATQPSTQLVRCSQPTAQVMWSRIKKEGRLLEPKINMIVLAKMRSYCPWPSQVMSINMKVKKAQVYFFGTHEFGKVDVNEIVGLEYCVELIKVLLKKKIEHFFKAVHEVEGILKIVIDE